MIDPFFCYQLYFAFLLFAGHSLQVLSVDEPMGIVTRADGEHLLVVGVKAKSQAADAGIKPGAYVTAVSKCTKKMITPNLSLLTSMIEPIS